MGVDVDLATLEKDYDAVFWGIGAQSGKALPVPGGEAPNCVSGVSFLRAFNEGRLQHLSGRVLVIGAGDTAMDVAAVARRIGHIQHAHDHDRPEQVILGNTVHDVATAARREGADVWIVYRRPISKAPATEHELKAVKAEGVEIHECLAPVEVLRDAEGKATALKVVPVDWEEGKMFPRKGEEYDIECTLVVGATGQAGEFIGFEDLDNGWGLMNADSYYRATARNGHFVGGDIIEPHLLTTAIGHASIACESIHNHIVGEELKKRPKVDVHHFSLLNELRSRGMEPGEYDHTQVRGTDSAAFAVHNYEDRSSAEIVAHEELFLGHFSHTPMHRRSEVDIDSSNVLGNFQERFVGLSEDEVVDEADRCMSCGLCFECDNCVIYCPQDAIFRVKKNQLAVGRYVDTDYDKCIGCHICMDVCPTGYIQMGLGAD